jgi:hypothetical protein
MSRVLAQLRLDLARALTEQSTLTGLRAAVFEALCARDPDRECPPTLRTGGGDPPVSVDLSGL